MKHGSTFFLKIVVFLLALSTLAVCVFLLPGMAADDAAKHPELAWQQYPFLAAAYLLCAIFLFGLYQSYRVLVYIDENKAFSNLSVRALNYVKYSAITIAVLIVAGTAIIIFLSAGTGEDITGIIMMGLLVTFASSIVATGASILQKHVQTAAEMQSENELIV